MNQRPTNPTTTPWRELRPILLLLILAVLVPAACLLWFMNEAMTNERLAGRQRLTDLYSAELSELRSVIDTFWIRRAEALAQRYVDEDAGERFARLVEAGIVDGAILFDETGHVAYPRLARAQPSTDEAATAARADIRSLLDAGANQEAIEQVVQLQDDSDLRDALDSHGRLILPDLQLLVLQRLTPKGDEQVAPLLQDLEHRLTSYGDSNMPSGQRRFLMAELQALDPGVPFLTLDAERLSETVLHAEEPTSLSLYLPPGGQGEWWFLPSVDGAAIGIYRRASMKQNLQELLDTQMSLPGIRVRLMAPDDPEVNPPFQTFPVGRALPDWQLGLFLDASDPFTTEADRKIGAYLWIGLLTIAVVAVLAILMASVLFRQIRLTRLKNDFIATVSHELKTPLSSMRVLVDTLLEGRVRDEQQEREYLQLIATENARLSRLIDNFLSFSRMERNKHAFDFGEVAPGELVETAADMVRDRFEAAGGTLQSESDPDLPPILADRDAMVTVLLNLLDNAFKYSGDEKWVRIRTFHADGDVCFSVEDRGLGLSRRDTRRIMDRFYQVDQRLSRATGGCGLGLSIVRFVVDAHHGSVDIQSRPGEGSTFTVRVPAGRPDHAREGGADG